MSYTGIYSPLMAVNSDHAPRITDPERFDKLCGTDDYSHEFSHVFEKQADIGEYQSEDYPRQSWDTLHGFRTWDTDMFQDYNLERLAWEYSPDSFQYFWGTVAEFCEPFWFAHSGHPSVWPRTHDTDFTDENPDYTGIVYRVTVHDPNEIAVERGHIEFNGFSEIDLP